MVGLRSRRGAILLEALVALAIVTLVGGGVLALVGAVVRDQRHLVARDRTEEEGDRVLAAMSLLGRRDLDVRLGRRTIGALVTEVTRPDRALYRIGVSVLDRPERELLATVVYRPVEPGR